MEFIMYAIAIFSNRTETLRFNAQLKTLGVNAMVVSTPKGLGSSCSVAVKFYYKQLSRVIYALKVGNYHTFNYFFKIVNTRSGNNYEIINFNQY